MKIISFNIRGLGGRIKKKEVRLLVRMQRPDLVCLQETKLERVDRKLCSSLWEGDDFDWACKDASGRSGGLLVIWRKGCLEVSSIFFGSCFLGFDGFWGESKTRVSIVNVYAPCDLRGKREAWEELVTLVETSNNGRWCILGDFNSVKNAGEERKGVDSFDRREDMELFCDFISEVGLIDLPLVGRKFTWYKPDGKAMSRLDRFLISEEWLSTWGNLSQWGLQRSVSDHYAVVLKDKEVNWGPKPFRMLSC